MDISLKNTREDLQMAEIKLETGGRQVTQEGASGHPWRFCTLHERHQVTYGRWNAASMRDIRSPLLDIYQVLPDGSAQ